MKRDIEKLNKDEFDILVIGGGIHGITVAREVARHGYKTALIEMNDFGHSTSFNSMKVIHGGLRYLQHGNLKRIRQSIRSRKIMQQVAPDLVKTVPFLIPTYGYGIKSKGAMSIAISINDLISFDRNYNIPAENYIPKGFTIGRNEILKILPGINKNKLTGGAVWYEAVVQNTEKLLMRFLADAHNYDFVAANYLEAKKFIIKNNEVKGVNVKDLISSKEFDITAKLVITAVGPWFNYIQKSLNISNNPKIALTKAVNIVVRKKMFSPYSVGLEGTRDFSDTNAIVKRGKRLFFFVPIEGYTMIGTSYKPYDGNINDCKIEKEDILEIIEEVNLISPSFKLTFDDVSFFHCGLLPKDETSDLENVQPERHSVIYDYQNDFNLKGLLSIKSVKYTTAPVIAEDVVKKISEKVTPFYGFRGKNLQFNKTIEVEIPSNLSGPSNHSDKVYNMVKEKKNLSDFVCDNPPVSATDIVNAVRNEMAYTLRDIILRRTGIGMLKCPSYESIVSIAEIMSKELGWDREREFFEINELLKMYSPLKNLESNVEFN